MVWAQRWATDARTEVDGAGMVDGRVTHRWDAGNVIGQPFPERFGVDFGGLDYDFFLLFGPDAVWDQTPPRPASSGSTVIGERERLPATSRPCWTDPGHSGCLQGSVAVQ
jgi:hypothetical protein